MIITLILIFIYFKYIKKAFKNSPLKKIKNKNDQILKILSIKDEVEQDNSSSKKKKRRGRRKLNLSAVKKGLTMLAKAIGMLVKIIITYAIPILIISIITILLYWVVFTFCIDNKGIEQEYQEEDIEYDNSLKKLDTGDYGISKMSKENTIIKAFYTFFSKDSYFIMIGDDKNVYKPGDDKVKKVKDAYGREKKFLLNPNALWSLDNYVHLDKFRYPEQFVKPVAFNKDTLELEPLVDENNNVIVDSHKYKKEGKYYKKDSELTKGIWDYGFAPILKFNKYEHTKRIVGSFDKEDAVDENGNVVQVSINIPIDESMDNFPKDKYLIEKAVTPAGSVSNKIEIKTTTKPISRYEIAGKSNDESYKTFVGEKTFTYTKEYKTTEKYKDKNGKTKTRKVTKTKEIEKTIDVYRYKSASTQVVEAKPEYVGEPNLENVTGSKYFIDYMRNYKNFIPKDVLQKFDFSRRTGLSEHELLKNLGEQAMDFSSVNIDMSQFKFGEGASTDNYKNSLQYLDIVKKYADRYGVDPYFVIAMMAQESGGQADANGAAIGLMQIEKSVHLGNTIHIKRVDGGEDVLELTEANMLDPEKNIQAGIWELKENAKMFYNNPLLTLLGYNYGPGGAKYCVTHYLEQQGKASLSDWSPNGSIAEPTKSAIEAYMKSGDTGWLSSREWYSSQGWQFFGAGPGNPKHLEMCMNYYINLDDPSGVPWIKGEDGVVYSANGAKDMTTGSFTGDGLSIDSLSKSDSWFNSWFKSAKSKLKDFFKDVFGVKPYSDECNSFRNNMNYTESNETLILMFTMEEKQHFSDYGDELTIDFWKTKFSLLFKNPMGENWGTSTPNNTINPNNFFEDGFENPIKDGKIIGKFGIDGYKYHIGIDISAPIGSSVKSVSKGTVTEVGKNSKYGKYIVIEHKPGVKTVYGNLDNIKVKKGSTIKKGETIGSVGKTSNENISGLHFELHKGGSPVDPTWIVTGIIGSSVNVDLGSLQGTDAGKKVVAEALKGVGKYAYVYGAKGEIMTSDRLNQLKGTYGAGEYPEPASSASIGIQAFDCSSFVEHVYKQFGANVPAPTYTQETLGREVSVSELQAGDLIFWGQRGATYHVGLAMGNGQYVHCSNAQDGVKISSLAGDNPSVCRRVLP